MSGHKSKIALLLSRQARATFERARQPPLCETLHAAGLLENGSSGRSSSVRVRNAVDGSLQQSGLHGSCPWDAGRKDGKQCPQEDGLRPCTGNKAACKDMADEYGGFAFLGEL